jgi:serine/threonine-protein kinase
VSVEGRVVAQRYELETLIGKGGIGEVWRARHLALNSRVAIKFLTGPSAQKESVRRRFTTEAQVTAQLKSPHAVQVFDFGFTEEGQPFIVMELLEGETLGHRIERVKRLAAAETVRILGQCARALQHAHQVGIVHRDFKPDNVMICTDPDGVERVKVLDFGVAKLIGALELGSEAQDEALADTDVAKVSLSSFTRTGAVLGTPLYMAPEQVRDAADVNLRADIWAFGVVAFECLTGFKPFTGANIGEVFARIQDARHPRAEFLVEGIKPGFDGWFDVACAPDRENRYPSAIIAYRQLAVALDVALGDDSNPRVMAESGEGPRVVVVPAGGPTADRASDPLGSVRARNERGELGSLGRIALHTTDRPPPIPSTDPLVHSRTHDKESRPPRHGWMAAAVAAGVLIAAFAAWRGAARLTRAAPASSGTGAFSATPATALPESSEPITTPSASVSVAAPALSPSSVSEAAPAPSAAATSPAVAVKPRLPPARPTSGPATSPAPSQTHEPIATATPTPPAAPPAPDPGSYR